MVNPACLDDPVANLENLKQLRCEYDRDNIVHWSCPSFPEVHYDKSASKADVCAIIVKGIQEHHEGNATRDGTGNPCLCFSLIPHDVMFMFRQLALRVRDRGGGRGRAGVHQGEGQTHGQGVAIPIAKTPVTPPTKTKTRVTTTTTTTRVSTTTKKKT